MEDFAGSLWVAQSKDGVHRPSVKSLSGRGQCIFQNGFKISCIYVYLQISDGCLIAFPVGLGEADPVFTDAHQRTLPRAVRATRSA